MWIKVTVTGAEGRHTEHAVDAQEEGEVAAAVGTALKDYRQLYPDAPPFDYSIKISHA